MSALVSNKSDTSRDARITGLVDESRTEFRWYMTSLRPDDRVGDNGICEKLCEECKH